MRFTVRGLAVTAALLTVLAACGSSDNGSSDTTAASAETSGGAATTSGGGTDTSAVGGSTDTSASGGSAPATGGGLEGAKARVEAAIVEPTEIGVSEPLSKTPDEGKNVYFLQCGVGICQAIGNEMDKAAALLKWNLHKVDLGTTPEEIVSGWNTVLASSPKPDAIITSGVPTAVFQSQLDQAHEQGIPVVDYASANPADPGIIFDVLPPEDNSTRGRLMADFVAADSDGKANTLLINIPDFPVLVVQQEAFEKEYAEVCDGCKFDSQDFSATDIGQAIPGAVVSYLQSNPDTNYVVVSFDDMGLGVAEAIEAAGLGDKVKMVAQSGSVSGVDNIVNDRVQVMTIPQGPGQVAFKVFDVLARQFNGDSLDADKANLLPIWIQTKDTITDPKTPWPGPPGFEDQFAALWQAGG
jgi:ribose transport system substrate-binding protein